MNKKQNELLENCIRVKITDAIPLFDEVYIIPQRKKHESGYKQMYVVGVADNKKYLLCTFSDVIDIETDKISIDIEFDGIIRLFNRNGTIKCGTFGISTCILC